MKNQLLFIALLATGLTLGLTACQGEGEGQTATADTQAPANAGQADIQDGNSEPTIVKVAIGSADHTTLVTALKAAELVDVLANVGPFTVFAPNNAAFEKLPAGTVEGLLKPEKKADLTNILKYHVTTSALTDVMLQDGMTLGMANGGKVTVHRDGDKIMINDATVLGVVKASNGLVYVIDSVLLPQ
ncbi:MAG: fasciclin domain-containing protein [Saprospiraceae bacterium]|nr:MAG: fasciclin domain-containing protein [Saprospiraceae bacterium]